MLKTSVKVIRPVIVIWLTSEKHQLSSSPNKLYFGLSLDHKHLKQVKNILKKLNTKDINIEILTRNY